MVISQDCPELREKGCPCEGPPSTPQVSDSVKLIAPLLFANWRVKLPRLTLAVLASVIVSVTGGAPTASGSKISAVGLSVNGCWQAAAPPTARQMLPDRKSVV